jgi:hypothetical protein
LQPGPQTLNGSLAVAIFSDTGALTGEFVFPLKRNRWGWKYDDRLAEKREVSRKKCLYIDMIHADTC